MNDIIKLLDSCVGTPAMLPKIYQEVILRADELRISDIICFGIKVERFSAIFTSFVRNFKYTEAEYMLDRAEVFGIHGHRARTEQLEGLLYVPFQCIGQYDGERIFELVQKVMIGLKPTRKNMRGDHSTLALTHIKGKISHFVSTWTFTSGRRVLAPSFNTTAMKIISLFAQINPQATGYILDSVGWSSICDLPSPYLMALAELKISISKHSQMSVFAMYDCIRAAQPDLLRLLLTKGRVDFTHRTSCVVFEGIMKGKSSGYTPLQAALKELTQCILDSDKEKRLKEIIKMLKTADVMLHLLIWDQQKDKLNTDLLRRWKHMVFG